MKRQSSFRQLRHLTKEAGLTIGQSVDALTAACTAFSQQGLTTTETIKRARTAVKLCRKSRKGRQ